MRSIGRVPKSSVAVNVRFPENHTSTGYVTSAVLASFITALGSFLIACAPAPNFTSSTTGDGI